MTEKMRSRDLEQIDPLNVAAYLAGQGWDEVTRDNSAITATLPSAGETVEVLVPLNRRLRDYALRIAQVVSTLADVEHRETDTVIGDLLVSADIVRLTVGDTDGPGTIPLDQGAEVFDAARELILAAACSTIEQRAVHPNRKPEAALTFLHEARLGQTERGSYVVTLFAPVPSVHDVADLGVMFPEMDIPYGRRVTETLVRALASAQSAARGLTETGEFHQFDESVADGVSSNLCEAIVRIGRAVPSVIGVGVSWSRVRPTDAPPNLVTFEPSDIEPLERGAEHFHQSAPQVGFHLEGWVTKLIRGEGEESGMVTIHGMVESGLRSVRVRLAGGDYDVAIEAHRDNRLVRCVGTLRHSARNYELDEPEGLSLIS